MPESQHHRPFDSFLLAGIALLTGYAVLAYGLTTPETLQVFDLGLAGLTFAWGLSLAIERRRPGIPPLFWILPVLILIYGWVSVGNGKYVHSWEGGGAFYEAKGTWGLGWLFGSVDRPRSLEAMAHLTVLFGGFFMLADLCRSRRNRRWLLGIVALAGLTVALAGIFQKASGTDKMLFFDGPLPERHFFAAYRYHGNAATLLSFAWPVAGMLFLRARIRGQGPFAITLWGAAVFFTLGAVFVNTSKMGQVLGVAMVPVWLLLYRRSIMGLVRLHPRPAMAGAVLGGLGALMLAALAGLTFSASVSRWADFGASYEARMETYRTCLRILPKSGFWGLGPGVFATVFPYYVGDEGRALDFFWDTAHEDYLQTAIEWGFVGAFLWAVFGGMVIASGIRGLRRGDFYTAATLVGLLAAAVQAVVDFPAQIGSLQWTGIIIASNICGGYNYRYPTKISSRRVNT